MRTRPLHLTPAVLVVAIAASGRAPAAPSTTRTGAIAATAASPAIAARIDVAAQKLFVRACPGLPCEPGADGAPIELTEALDLGKARFDAVSVGAGRQVLRVVVPTRDRPGVAFEALIGARDGAARVLFAGGTGFGGGGEGSGARIMLEGSDVYVGKLRRELTVCGMSETLLEPRRLDAKTMELRRVAMHRIPASARSAAATLVAEPAKAEPVGSLLSVRGASVHDGASTNLADDDEATAWTETLKGDGKGEFVVFSAPKAMAFDRLSLVIAPSKPIDGFAPPSSLWLSTDDATYRIAIPRTDARRVDVALPQPIRTSCLALSIDKGEGKDPTVGLVEVDAVPILPSTVQSLDDVVTLLDSKDGDLAQTVLLNAGARGAAAIAKKLAALGDEGRGRAIDILDGAPCEAASLPLATLAWEAPKREAARAREALDHCGVAAAPALAAVYASGGDAAREVLAERWMKVDAKAALPAVLETVRTAPATRRRTFRVALGRAAERASGRDAITAWLASEAAARANKPGETDPLIELARAIAAVPGLAESPQLVRDLAQHVVARAGDKAPFEARWLAAEPLAALALRGEPGALAALRAMHRLDDRYLRARAVDVSGPVDALRPEIVAALRDPDPRVRQTAVIALRRGQGPTGAVAPTVALLKGDAWTYVRAAAAETLGESKGGGDVDVALGEATRDELPAVRAAAVRALVSRGARSQLPAIRKLAFSGGELVDVRAEAITALGKLCDRESVDELFDVARRGSGSEGAHQLALAAVIALGEIHPSDLAQRLGALDQTSLVMKDAVRRALKSPSTCS